MWALLPVALLILGVASGKLNVQWAGTVAIATAVVVGWFAFDAGALVQAVALEKGIWLGIWISLVVVPALLLYRIAAAAGLSKVTALFERVSDRHVERLLLISWLASSLFQGVAGFGAPIAITAPLLLAMGYSATKAVIYPLVGYCWSVTFGSMATSYYTAVVTSGIDGPTTDRFTLLAAIVLGVVSMFCGALVVLMEAGWRGLRKTLPYLLVVGLPMGGTLVLIATIAPAVASTSAAAVGLLMAAGFARVRRIRSKHVVEHTSSDADFRQGVIVIMPYLALVVLVLAVTLPPGWSDWANHHLVIGFGVPETSTGTGWVNAALDTYRGLPLLSHPGSFLLVVCVIAVVTYRRAGIWPEGSLGPVMRAWGKAVPKSAAPIIIFAAFALLLTDTGMMHELATRIANIFGSHVLLIAPLLGALGSFLTGSSTSSNALLAGLQAQAAGLASVDKAVVLAAQTAGANLGNSLAPVVISVGAATTGAEEHARTIMASSGKRVAVLMVVLLGLVYALS